MHGKKDGIPKHKGFPKYKDGMMKMTPKQKAVAGGMPMEVANKIGIPKKGSNEPMMNYSSFKSYNIKAGGSKNTGEGSFSMKNATLQKSARYGDPMQKNFLGKVLGAGIMGGMPKTTTTGDKEISKELRDQGFGNYTKDPVTGQSKVSRPATKEEIEAARSKKEIEAAKKEIEAAKSKKNGFTKTYKEAYKDADKSKYKTYGEFEKAAKDYNTKKYGTTEPTKYAKGTGRTKEKLASDNKKNVEVKKKEQVKKATVKEKKTPIGPKERTTVKKAKATKKAGVKDAKQKGYETRKDRRAAVSDARKAGRAGVKEARKDKRDLKKAEKNTRKRDKKQVKAAITDSKRAAKIDKLKSKKSTNKRSNKIDDLQAKRKLNSDEPLAKYKK